jgi:Cytotoxic translational repressor of toxin-antitoxin stability system
MAHSIEVKPSADKVIDGLAEKARVRILKAIRGLAINPRPTGCKKLKSTDLYRIRVGDYRVIYEIHDDVLVVLVIKVGHRQDVYQG